MGFSGFPRDTLEFLADLAANNDRAWFKARQKRYEAAVKAPLAELCDAVDARADAEGLSIGADPKRSPFRIHRDIRFSPDKRPYKTHIGVYFGPTGSRKEAGGVYLHVEPAGSFLASGIYQPDGDSLRQIRQWIVDHPQRFADMIDDLAAKDLTPRPDEAVLKRLPPAFAAHKDAPIADYLRWKRFINYRALGRQTIESAALIDDIARMAEDTEDFRAWCREVQVPRAVA